MIPKKHNAILSVFIFLFIAFCFSQASARGQAKPAAKPAEKSAETDYSPLFNQLKLRNIGPAAMGGRTVDFAVLESNTSIIYAAVGPSGVWKSVNAGVTWLPVFHKENAVAVGAVAVSQSNPDIVWAGSGEATARNSVGIGDGVYKSEDGGKTWKNMGLPDSRHISRIIIDTANPDVVYVGSQGHLFGPNEERGVFKTADGGKTWKRTLFVNPDTGASDLAIDPSNNKILYAGMWNYRRNPFYFRSGGAGSGVYRTLDGGETWKILDGNGLPSTEVIVGRIGLGVSRSRPNVVYALVEAKDGGLFRSDDKGETWSRQCDKRTYDRINFRPFYYSRLTVDPNNDLVVYVYSGSTYVSRDAGKTFTAISRGTHPDHHAVWVDPHNSNHIIDGNDGGIDISYDGGRSWYEVEDYAWSEVYQVGLDNRDPYYVYVGLQDNGSWGGPSNSLDGMGIMNHHWYPVGGGDGFYAQVDQKDYRIIFRNLQMGNIERYNIETGETTGIKPIAPLSEPPYRFNWNSPIYVSPNDPNVLYFGGNFLFKSTDRGRSWTRLGPDLTSNDPKKKIDSGGPITVDNTGAEIHCTILTISESMAQPGIIWVGTDDGLVQVTKDGSQSWTNVTKNIKGLPPDSWVSRVEAGHFAAGTAYATFDRHWWDDYKPYIYKTEDFGATWTPLKGNLPDIGYLRVVREDPVNKNLLFCGSEFGLYVSFDGGKSWISKWKDFPTVAVHDIQIHPREKDLVIGTHGRGVWIIDDIRCLEAMPEAINNDFMLFPARTSVLYSLRSSVEYYSSPGFAAPNPSYGACVTYYLKDKPGATDKLTLTVLDAQGKEIRVLKATPEKGINRFYWDLREAAPETGDAERDDDDYGYMMGGIGPWALPGQYKIVLNLNGRKSEQPLEVKPDPKHVYTMEERNLGRKFARDIADLNQKGGQYIKTMNEIWAQLDQVEKDIRAQKTADQSLLEAVKALRAKAQPLKEAYAMSKPEQSGYRTPYEIALRDGTLPEQLMMIMYTVMESQGAPTQAVISLYQDIEAVLVPLLQKLDALVKTDVPTLNKLLNEKNFPHIKLN